MWHFGCGFQQQQTSLGLCQRDAAAAAFLRQRRKVGGVVETEEAEFETVLSFGLPVTTARVAAGLGQNGLYFVLKRNRWWRLKSLDVDGYLCCLVANGHGQRCGSVPHWSDQAQFVDSGDARIRELECDGAGDIKPSFLTVL